VLYRFDFMTIIGLSAAAVVVVSAVISGSRLDLYWNIPAVMITILGSFFTVVVQHDYQQVKDVLKVAKKAFSTETAEPQELIPVFVKLARKARREGLLALEEDVDLIPDPFFAKGLQLMVDAVDPDTIRDILETEIYSMEERHEKGQSIFRRWASMAPAFGMIGTLVGLVQMLSVLDDPSALGPGMSIALLTTLYGVLLANLILTPIAGKLELRSSEEVKFKTLILEGVISIQSGVNPRILEEKLNALIPPSHRYGNGIEVSVHVPS
jgi:chemotaxis protein MotA